MPDAKKTFRTRFPLVFLMTAGAVFVVMAFGGCEDFGPKHIATWSQAQSPEGWKGRRYSENGRVVAEEWDALGKDGRIDIWRFYENSILFLEEHDRDADGRIDFTAEYELTKGYLKELIRDTNFDGKMDLWIETDGDGEWTQIWDRNHDDVADYNFVFEGGGNLLQSVDTYEVLDFRRLVPTAKWKEVALDTDHDGRFDVWTRYENGIVVARGADDTGDGQPNRWIAVAPPSIGAASTEKMKRKTEEKSEEYIHITQFQPVSAEALAQQEAMRQQQKQKIVSPPIPNEFEPPVEDRQTSPAPMEQKEEAATPRRGFLDRLRGLFRRKEKDSTDTPPSAAETSVESTSPAAIPADAGADAPLLKTGAPKPEENARPTARVQARVRSSSPTASATEANEQPLPPKTSPSPTDEPDVPPPAMPRPSFRHPSEGLAQ